MPKGSITSIIIFLVLIIIFASYAAYYSMIEVENSRTLLEVERIRQQTWELNKLILQKETFLASNFWNDSQTLKKTDLMVKYNVTNWSNTVIITMPINYYYANGFIAEYSGNHSFTINYSTELIDKTGGIAVNDIMLCACPELNQTKCNEINDTNFSWELHACTGLPTKYSISVFNTNMTKNYQRYLFNAECFIDCV